MAEALASPGPLRCAGCGSELSPSLLACPACQRLVHADALRDLAREAEQAEAAKDFATAHKRWTRALSLLPPGAAQFEAVRQRAAAAQSHLDAPPADPKSPLGKTAGLGGAVLLALWKLKFVVLLVLSKAKLLLLGLTKLQTLLSMAAYIGVYWALFGWRWAVGFALCIYVHEMGHVMALRRMGVEASSPMFIPGLGAFVRLKQEFSSVVDDARSGLAGPLYGLGATLFCWAVALATGSELFRALAYSSAAINLFNLLPLWSLDGGRGVRSLARRERWILAVVSLVSFAAFRDGVLLLIALGAGYQATQSDAPQKPDTEGLTRFAGLVVALGFLAAVNRT